MGLVPFDLTRGGSLFAFHATHNINQYALIDARILNVITGRPLPGATLTANGKFPDDYAAILQQLTGKLLTALRISVSTTE